MAGLLASSCYCQRSSAVSAIPDFFIKSNTILSFPGFGQSAGFPRQKATFYNLAPDRFSNIIEVKNNTNQFTTSLPVLADDFSTCNYAFFCKQELKLEKISHLQIRIRLGSLAQCNYYEGKRQ